MYDSFAPDYDRFVNWPERLLFETPFIESRLNQIPAQNKPLKVLDAACGTGQHAIALTQHGYQVSAADLSVPMVEQARANARAASVKLDIRPAGFGSLAQTFGNDVFDAVLCLGNSLPHLLTPADLQAALADFAACLRPGGVLLIQNRNFDAVMRTKQRWMDPQMYQDDQHEWLFLRFYDFEANELIRFNVVTLKRPLQGEWESSADSTFLAPQLSGDLVKALTSAHFNNIQRFGSMAGEVYDPLSSGNLVLAAYRAKKNN
jgi:glycine/sarcosine N-methyltransferase